MKPSFVPDPRGDLWIWEHPQKDAEYVVAADTAEGVRGGDLCAAQVLNAHTGEQVAEWEALMDPPLWGRRMAAFATYYNNAWLVFETGVSAHGVSAAQSALITGYQKLYRRRQMDTVLKKQTEKLGFATTQLTKPIVINHAREAVKGGFKINSTRLLRQMGRTKFGEDGDQKIYTEGHDDLLIAYAIACYVRAEAWNIGLVEQEEAPKDRIKSHEDWISLMAQEDYDRFAEGVDLLEEQPWEGA